MSGGPAAEPRLVVLLGSASRVSHAAGVLQAALGSARSPRGVDEGLRSAMGLGAEAFPPLEDFRAVSPEWPPAGARAASRIRSLLAAPGSVRHDLLVEGRLIGRLVGPRGAVHKALEAHTGCTVVFLGAVGDAEPAARRDRAPLAACNAELEALPPRERGLEVARRTRRSKLAGLCEHCWLRSPFCICGAVRSLGPLHTAKVSVHVAVHYKEYGRATSTAKLLPLLAPGAAELHPYPEASERLVEALSGGPALLLLPRPGARPAAELQPWLAAQARRVPLLVVDGTWGNVKSMGRQLLGALPGLAAVHVCAEVRGPSRFTGRRQVSADRVSTVEAVALALQALGETGFLGPALAALDTDASVKMVVEEFKAL